MALEISPWRPFREMVPFREFDRMRREMYRVLESFFQAPERGEGRGDWLPAVDVKETKNEIVVKAEVPGMEPKDIDISLTDHMLVIRGEKRQEKEEKDENYQVIETHYGAFVRSIEIPANVRADNIQASYKNGVLKIVLPKSEEAKKKEVKIKIEQEASGKETARQSAFLKETSSKQVQSKRPSQKVS